MRVTEVKLYMREDNGKLLNYMFMSLTNKMCIMNDCLKVFTLQLKPE